MPRGATPALNFGWERLSDLMREPALQELLADHFEEVGDREFNVLAPQWDHWLDLEKRGILRIWVARADGDFAGYAVWYVDRHPGSGLLYAWSGPFYLAPEHRLGRNGMELLTGAERDLAAEGAKRAILHENVRKPLQPLLVQAGYQLFERRYVKVL